MVEDTTATLQDVRDAFGEEVAKVVDGLTKIARVQFRTNTEQQVENYRKLLLSMAQDARVILIKLADRLHNMRTLEHLREEKRRRIALETREIYAPLAHRLGMATIKWELEDLCFKFLEPEAYKDLARKIAEKRHEREELIELLRGAAGGRTCKAAGIECEVTGRPKHLWSIHRKMEKRDKPYEEIYDLMAVRVIVETITDCYHALGIIHNQWTPLQERFHDYIATPEVEPLPVAAHDHLRTGRAPVRDPDPHARDAPHRGVRYRGALEVQGGRAQPAAAGNEVDETLSWFRQVLEWQQDTPRAGGVHGVPPHRPLPGRDLRLHAAGRREAAAAWRDPDRLRLRGAHRGRAALRRREGERAHHAALARAAERRHGRDPHRREAAPLARLARLREDGAGAQQDPAVDQGGGVRQLAFASARSSSSARCRRRAAGRSRRTGTTWWRRRWSFPDAEHLFAALGRGDIGPSAVFRELWPDAPEPEPARPPSAFERLVSRVRGELRRSADPGDGEPDGPLLASAASRCRATR